MFYWEPNTKNERLRLNNHHLCLLCSVWSNRPWKIIYRAGCYCFQMNCVLLIWYITHKNLSRLWNLPRVDINMIKLQVDPNDQKQQNWCSTDWHFHRKLGRSKGPRLQERARPDSRPSPDPAAGVVSLSMYKNRLTAGRHELFLCIEMYIHEVSSWCDNKL